MTKILTILAICAVCSGCSVEIISDKEAIERLHAEEAKEQLNNAEQIAILFSNAAVNPAAVEVKVSDYKDSPIFVTHAKRLEEQGLPYDSSQIFTTEAYEEALAIQANYQQKKSLPVTESDDDHHHSH